MSAIFGETLSFTQAEGEEVRLVVFGDEHYARYETLDGYTSVYDASAGAYCYADLKDGRFQSTGVRIDSYDAPGGVPRHLRESGPVMAEAHRRRRPGTLSAEAEEDSALTFGPTGGLLEGRRLSVGSVRGLTILVDFPDQATTVTPAQVDALLNAPGYHENGNACSVNEYYKTMSSGLLDFTNDVVGPFRMSHDITFYADPANFDVLVPEALRAAVDSGIDLTRYDSLGQQVVDALIVLYAGKTQYIKDSVLWPHNSVVELEFGDMRTHFYLVTSMGESPEQLTIGTFCHESGHLLCRFPDLYDYGRRDGDDFTSSGLGLYCLMSAGNHLDGGKTPAPVSAYLRDLAGWCPEKTDLNLGGVFQAEHGDYRKVFRYSTGTDEEYFLVENRSKLGFDLHSPAGGLAVYHCDTRGSNELQDGTPLHHYQIALLQADGHLDLENNLNSGDSRDLYGRVDGTALSHSTVPASLLWSGAESGLTLSAISDPGQTIRFRAGPVGVNGAAFSSVSRPALRIPDSDPHGVADTITIEAEGTVRTLKILIDLDHNHPEDLRIVLHSPTGRRIVLAHREAALDTSKLLEYATEPPSAVTPLVGQPAGGGWTLLVSDLAPSHATAGILSAWRLDIVTGT
ncbi:M6 family metalloprotease domain-containing protein [Nonomuraea sp. NPDC049695]|uniref:M6 family metalloprotease domain-containing protein n=1 Tax=Nonomuraea sp. NPDC049695 TaxID=3154734 RepID=UPI0034126A21